ncbi:MAG: polysaccharide biosynthesis tyrosine autokinase [Balneolaceae bacterium]|nr:polysaccharide biosynthesis tyrosine autokinase [Balneolaceae bacterium]
MSNSLQHNKPGGEKNGLSKFEYVPTYSVSDDKNQDPLDPQKLVALVLRYKWLILVFLIIGATGGWYYSGTVTPTFETSGTLMISSGSSSDDELSRIISQTTGVGTSSTLSNELQILRSRDFARQVALKIKAENPGDHNEFPLLWNVDEEGNVEEAADGTITARVRRNLSATRLDRDTDIIQIDFKSISPVEAAHVVNTAMEVYIERSTLQNRQAAESTAAFLETEREEIERRLNQSEQRLKEFMDRTGIVQVDEQASTMAARRAEVEAELERVRLELQTIEQAISNHERQMDNIRPGLSDQFSEAVGPRIRANQDQLASYENERTLILTRNPGVRDREVTPPRLKYLDDQIDRVKAEIRELSNQLFSEDDEYLGMDSEERAQMVATIQTRLVELRIEQNQNRSRVEALEERKQDVDINLQSLPNEIIQLAQLERDVRMNEALYEDVSRRFADMSVLKQSQFGFGRIVDDALVPGAPVSPNQKILLLMGMMLGGIFAVAVIFIKEFRDDSISSIDQLRPLHLPLLAAVPKFEKIPRRKRKTFEAGEGEVPEGLVLVQNRLSVASESIRRLKNNIVYQFGDTPPKTIGVTSAEKGDGKSTIVSNLGIAFAEAEFKTLIIDTDFRRPKIHEYFGLKNELGLSDHLVNKTPVMKLFQSTENSLLKVISAGSQRERPENMANSKEFKSFLEKMKEVFDVIIIDTPPFGIISDSAALLKSVESTIVVAKHHKTNRDIFAKTIEELERIHVNLNGIVLNGFDHKKETGSNYGSGYYQAIYSGYDAYVK